MERLPIPDLTAQQESDLADLAETITALANQRYTLHEDTRRLISQEFADGEPISTRVTLYQWWENVPDSKALDDEVRKRFKASVPLKQRKEWDTYLREQHAAHQRLTDEIIQHETRLNAIVYDAFDLTPEERALIEQATKYPYGAV